MLLVAITFVFLGVIFFVLTRQQIVVNQTTKAPLSPTTVMGPISLLLKAPLTVATDSTFPVDVTFSGVTKDIIASDVLLQYDTTKLEFLGVQNVHPQYMNPRKLYENNTLIVSFIEKPTSVTPTTVDSTITLGQLLFRAKQAGTVTFNPILNTGSRSSLTFVEGNELNQLGKANAVDVVIK